MTYIFYKNTENCEVQYGCSDNGCNSINTMNLMVAMQLEANAIFVVNDGKEYEKMGTLLEQYMGKECVVSLFNEVGAIKGKLMDGDAQWLKVETKKGTQLINRNMVRNITFENK